MSVLLRCAGTGADLPANLRPRRLATHCLIANQQTQRSARFGSQLQPAKGSPVELLGPGQHRAHARRAEHLVNRPDLIAWATGTQQQHVAPGDAPAMGGGRIKTASTVNHYQRPMPIARLASGEQGQRTRPATSARAQPFDQRRASMPLLRQQAVERFDAAADPRPLARPRGLLQSPHLLLKRADSLPLVIFLGNFSHQPISPRC